MVTSKVGKCYAFTDFEALKELFLLRKKIWDEIWMNLRFLNEYIKESKILESLWITNRLELVNNIKRDKMLMISLLSLHSISSCDVVGDPCKVRVYGFGCNQHFRRSYNGNSNEMCSHEKNKELFQEIEDMRATNKRMEEELLKVKINWNLLSKKIDRWKNNVSRKVGKEKKI
ncbi:uncharacterized protein LOC122045855 isoform X2 [Zingiber officinale]|uniref:uncharacterized protein LOC122045855 isoform X2 n=1 Tax=Zingiber officinale TaxID=94328 RepID=UPI001C4D63BD|nr:uncharacterized protein LOC122045855 isoform X2 [Zingiber officinale]